MDTHQGEWKMLPADRGGVNSVAGNLTAAPREKRSQLTPLLSKVDDQSRSDATPPHLGALTQSFGLLSPFAARNDTFSIISGPSCD